MTRRGFVRAVLNHRASSAEASGAALTSRFDSLAALEAWRAVLAIQIDRDCAAAYRAEAIDGYGASKPLFRDGPRATRHRDELSVDADPDAFALVLRSALEGGLLAGPVRTSRPCVPVSTP